MNDLSTIDLQGDKIPILCTMEVLEDIQNEFGTIPAFIEKLAPTVKDEDGETKIDENGYPVFSGEVPDLHTLTFALPRLIQNGIEVYNSHHNIKIPFMTKTEIWQKNENSVFSTASTIYVEVMRSIHAPKPQPSTGTTSQQAAVKSK